MIKTSRRQIIPLRAEYCSHYRTAFLQEEALLTVCSVVYSRRTVIASSCQPVAIWAERECNDRAVVFECKELFPCCSIEYSCCFVIASCYHPPAIRTKNHGS